jgi:hypothetical protein
MKLNRTSLLFIVAIVASVEAIIILYNNATGYVLLGGPLEFLFRLTFATVAATPVAIALFLINSALIRTLDTLLPWERRFVSRIPGEALLAAVIGSVPGAVLTLAVHAIAPYSDGLVKNVVNNGLIAGVLNILIMAGLEAFIAARRGAEERHRAEMLERENADIRFNLLKTQLNPHFLFNSLNVLSSLISRDPARAQHFVDEFAAVYRYILEVIDLPLVGLRRELDFVRSYLYLQSLRFTDAVHIEIEVASDQLDLLVPPLAVQTVVENAFKHNRATAEAPLLIAIGAKDGMLVVRNTLHPRAARNLSTGIGLENLRKRFHHLGTRPPRFTLAHDQFVAELPLITHE